VTVGVLAAAVLAVGLAVRLGRPVVADLRRLRDGARTVAYEQLPQLTSRLNQPQGWKEAHPDQLAASVPTTGVAGRHEVGEVAAAFDDVYRAAVRSAAELARSRLGVAQMHISLARRLQRRTGQLTTRLDAAERHEQDPGRLDWLFGLDHLVTLMRRTTDSLLVLGGHGPGTVRAHPVPMLDVLRAAAARIEDYARVRIFPVEEELCVSGHLVDELILLVAELMDNAVMLSRDPVAVHVRRLADRTVVQVIDLGIGMDERRRRVLNDRLAAPVVDVDSVSRMGLTVVGLLAAHHGLRVELRSNLPRGTIAEIAVPGGLLRLPSPRSTMDGVGAKHRARPAALVAPPELQPRTMDDRPSVTGESTAELPAFASLPAPVGLGQPAGEWTPGGLPIRSPQVHEFPDRPTDRGFSRRRDPRHIAAALSAYARGISQGRAQQRP
jgi:signal transduction histidine kinase